MADRLDGVLINSVAVIHIELHHCDDRLKFGDERGKHPKLVHSAQRAFGVVVFEKQVEKDALGLRGAAQIIIDQWNVGGQNPHRVGMDQSTRAQCFFKDTQHIHGRFNEYLWVRHRDAVLLNCKRRTYPWFAFENTH